MKFRAPVREDAPAVFDVLVARNVADLGAPDATLEDLQDEWRADDFDLAGDALMAEDEGGLIVAYAAQFRPGTLAAVARTTRGEGLERACSSGGAARPRARSRATLAVDRG